MLPSLEDLPAPTSEKNLVLAAGVAKKGLAKSYFSPFKATKEIKLATLQYKIIHRISQTNSFEKSCLTLLSLLSFLSPGQTARDSR